MSIATGDLLKLVRLMEDRLEAADGVRVRERLAVDKDLLTGWRTLARVLEHEVSHDDPRAAELIEPERIAAFIEERLDPSEAAHLEQICWNHPALLREVVSAFRAFYDDESETPAEQAVTQQAMRRMDTIVSQQCSMPPSQPQPPPRHRNNGSSSAPAVSPSQPAEQRAPRRVRRESSRPVLTRRASSAAARTSRGRFSPGLIAVSAVVLLLVAGWFVFSRLSGSRTTAPGTIVNEPPTHAPSPPPKAPDRPRNPSGLAHRPPDGGISGSPDSGPGSTSPDKKTQPTPDGGSAHSVVGIKWNSLSGIVAARRRDRNRWAGILALAGRKSTAADPVIVRTLPGSRIAGHLPTGAGMILDGNSEVRVSVGGTDGSVFNIEPRQGRVAVVNLDSGDQVRCQIGTRTWTVQSRAEKTSVGFTRRDRQAKTWDLLAWNGGVTVDAVPLSAGHSLKWDGDAFGDPVPLGGQSDWRSASRPKSVLPRAQTDRCNNSNDLATALLDVAKQGNADQQTATIAMGFSLDPVTAVPAAAVSSDSRQRTAAIGWLLAATESSPVTRRVWNRLESAIDSRGQDIKLRRWFAAIKSGRKPQAADLGRLVHGLLPRQPLFVRQCAINFLRQITNLPLAEYHPERPTRAALKSVALQVRRATGNAHPRSRKGKRRLRSRKKKDVRRRAR